MPTAPLHFTKTARDSLSVAQAKAEQLNHNAIGTGHLILALVELKRAQTYELLSELGFKSNLVERVLKGRYPDRGPFKKLELTDDLKRALEKSVDAARKRKHKMISTYHILIGLAQLCDKETKAIFDAASVTCKQVIQAVDDDLKSYREEDENRVREGGFDAAVDVALQQLIPNIASEDWHILAELSRQVNGVVDEFGGPDQVTSEDRREIIGRVLFELLKQARDRE